MMHPILQIIDITSGILNCFIYFPLFLFNALIESFFGKKLLTSRSNFILRLYYKSQKNPLNKNIEKIYEYDIITKTELVRISL